MAYSSQRLAAVLFQTHTACLPLEAPDVLNFRHFLGTLMHEMVCFRLTPPPIPLFFPSLGFHFQNIVAVCNLLSSLFLCFCGFIFYFLIFTFILQGLGRERQIWVSNLSCLLEVRLFFLPVFSTSLRALLNIS